MDNDTTDFGAEGGEPGDGSGEGDRHQSQSGLPENAAPDPSARRDATISRFAPLWAAISSVLIPIGVVGVAYSLNGGNLPDAASSSALSVVGGLFVVAVVVSLALFVWSLHVRDSPLKYSAAGAVCFYFVLSGLPGIPDVLALGAVTVVGLHPLVFLVAAYTSWFPSEFSGADVDASDLAEISTGTTVLEHGDHEATVADTTVNGYQRIRDSYIVEGSPGGTATTAVEGADGDGERATRTAPPGSTSSGETTSARRSNERNGDIADTAEDLLLDE